MKPDKKYSFHVVYMTAASVWIALRLAQLIDFLPSAFMIIALILIVTRVVMWANKWEK